MEAYIKSKIRTVNDFPKKGISFKDITTLLNDPDAFKKTADALYNIIRQKEIDKIAVIESRGFLFGALLAQQLNVGLVLIRKPGKLPADTISASYELEYGTDVIEMHKDAILPGEQVLIHDDLLATGGTAEAACRLVEKAGGVVSELAFIVELSFLKGREKLKNRKISSLVTYD